MDASFLAEFRRDVREQRLLWRAPRDRIVRRMRRHPVFLEHGDEEIARLVDETLAELG